MKLCSFRNDSEINKKKQIGRNENRYNTILHRKRKIDWQLLQKLDNHEHARSEFRSIDQMPPTI